MWPIKESDTLSDTNGLLDHWVVLSLLVYFLFEYFNSDQILSVSPVLHLNCRMSICVIVKINSYWIYFEFYVWYCFFNFTSIHFTLPSHISINPSLLSILIITISPFGRSDSYNHDKYTIRYYAYTAAWLKPCMLLDNTICQLEKSLNFYWSATMVSGLCLRSCQYLWQPSGEKFVSFGKDHRAFISRDNKLTQSIFKVLIFHWNWLTRLLVTLKCQKDLILLHNISFWVTRRRISRLHRLSMVAYFYGVFVYTCVHFL